MPIRYALLIHELPGAYDSFDDEQRAATHADYLALRGDERVIGGERLAPADTATTVRAGARELLLTDGPFADTKEVFGGFFLVEAPRPGRRAGDRRPDPGGAPRWVGGDPAAGARLDRCSTRSSAPSGPGCSPRWWGSAVTSTWPKTARRRRSPSPPPVGRMKGHPANPRAWLVATGRNRAIDRLRRERSLTEKTRLLDRPESGEITMAETTIPDERLELVFLCCHPALAPEARVALTLRALGGQSTPEIARAFLVSEETMKRRLTRARTKIGAAAIPFAVPQAHALPARLGTVLAVLYLIFNQGYGDGRVDLAAEAIRLARTLGELMPDEPRITALLALMLLHDSRRDARSADGEIVPLADQDRAAGMPARSPRDGRCSTMP